MTHCYYCYKIRGDVKSKSAISISIDNCFVFAISVVLTIFSSLFQSINLEILGRNFTCNSVVFPKDILPCFCFETAIKIDVKNLIFNSRIQCP